MPSHPRQKQTFHKKTKQVTDHEGWTHVVKGPKSDAKPQDITSQLQHRNLDVQLSPAETAQQQHKYHSAWADSQCCRDLHRFLENEILPLDHFRLDNCVCLGLGSFTDGRESSKHQLAMLSWILDDLNEKHAIKQVIFQDPAFNRSDLAYLRSRGHTVLETPRAFEAIGRSTFLFAPHLESIVYATAVEKEIPALCVGSDVKAYLDRTQSSNAELERRAWEKSTFQRFYDAVHSTPFPEYERDTWWVLTKVYWHRRSEGSDRAEHSVTPMDQT